MMCGATAFIHRRGEPQPGGCGKVQVVSEEKTEMTLEYGKRALKDGFEIRIQVVHESNCPTFLQASFPDMANGCEVHGSLLQLLSVSRARGFDAKLPDDERCHKFTYKYPLEKSIIGG